MINQAKAQLLLEILCYLPIALCADCLLSLCFLNTPCHQQSPGFSSWSQIQYPLKSMEKIPGSYALLCYMSQSMSLRVHYTWFIRC